MLNNICEQQINVITTVFIIIRHDVKFKFAISTVNSGQHKHNWHETFLLLNIYHQRLKEIIYKNLQWFIFEIVTGEQ